MKNKLTSIALSIFLASCVFGQQQPSRDVSRETARSSQEWVKDAVIYQIWERAYSQKGDFNSITGDLDRIKTLGVDVLWLMPVHPVGQVKRKVRSARRTRFVIITVSTLITARLRTSNGLWPRR